MVKRHSIKRITGWSLFLGAALFFALITFYLPELLNLDAYRPQVVDLLEKTFHCQAEIGHVRAQVFPSPGLYVGRMALVEPNGTRRVLASGGLHVSLSWKSLVKGRLQFETLQFMRPRFIAHRDIDAAGVTSWTVLTLPHTALPSRPTPINNVAVRAGQLEVWDHRTHPAARWIMDSVTGTFQMNVKQGAFTANPLFLGRGSRLDIRYDQSKDFPLDARISQISLAALQKVLRISLPALQGTAEATLKARVAPELELQATISPLQLDRLKGTRLGGTVSFQDHHLRARIKSIAAQPMVLTLDADFPKGRWSLQGAVTGYDASLVRQLYEQTWINRLSGAGTLTFAAQSGPAGAVSSWGWSAGGRGFSLAGSPFNLPDWSAQGNARTTVVYVRAATPQGGAGEVVWEHPAISSHSLLTVNLTSVTVRQVLELFQLEAKPAAVPTSGWNPYAYESWLISHADMESVVYSTGTLQIQDSDIDMAGMHIDLSGNFGLSSPSKAAQIQGDIYYMPMASTIESFTKTASPLTGIAQVDFNLNFPLNSSWLRQLNGTLHLNAVNGVLREFKTFYRVMSVLNLTNYFKFRMPQVTAEGVAYQTLSGWVAFTNGVASTQDLFLRSPNLNIGIQGAVDLIMKRIDTTLRIELFRFLEDVLKNVPITHWIFKKPTKIFLPLVVHVKGPWDNPDVT